MRSSWRSIRSSIRCTTVTSIPRLTSPLAASKPSNPPPITAALLYCLAAANIVSQSAISRKPTTPSLSLPGTGRMNEFEPVAIITLLYGTSIPLSVNICWEASSILVTVVLVCNIILFSLYQFKSLSIISSTVLLPSRT